MDTIRLLAKETDNLVDELWNYIKRKKLHQTTILLLAAHEHIRGDISSRNGKQNGFAIIMNRIVEQLSSKNKKGEKGSTRKQLEESMALGEAFKLVNIISEAGEDLNKYIQAHSEVLHFVKCICASPDLFLSVLFCISILSCKCRALISTIPCS